MRAILGCEFRDENGEPITTIEKHGPEFRIQFGGWESQVVSNMVIYVYLKYTNH